MTGKSLSQTATSPHFSKMKLSTGEEAVEHGTPRDAITEKWPATTPTTTCSTQEERKEDPDCSGFRFRRFGGGGEAGQTDKTGTGKTGAGETDLS